MDKRAKFSIGFLFMMFVFLNACQEYYEYPEINNPPFISNQEFYLTENSPKNTVVDTVVATDIDFGNKLKFSILHGDINEAFCIDSLTGVITVNDSTQIDYEVTTKFELVIKVIDKQGLISLAKITIHVIDEDESSLNDGLVAYYPFNSNANDESVNMYNGTVYGAKLANDKNGKSNSCYEFDGINDYIEVINFGNIVPTKEISVSIWIQSNESKFQFQLMLCPDNNRFAISAFYQHWGTNTTFWDFGWPGTSGDSPGRLYFRPEPIDTLWHHYVFISSLSNNFMKLYKDGILLNEKTEPKELLNVTNRNLKIGCADSMAFHDGKIDEIRIYNRVLTELEINELYNF